MFLNPEKIINDINLPNNITVADFGCGSGGFTVPLSEHLTNGRVIAVDVQEEPLSALKSRAASFNNIKIIKGDLEKINGSKIEDESVDMVFLVNIIFQIEEVENIITEARRVLKPEGEILIIDWKEDAPHGPEQGRLPVSAIQDLAESLRFEKEKEFEAGVYHYGLLMKKS